jgi:hypothetical protein
LNRAILFRLPGEPPEIVDGCEQGVRIAGQFCAGPIHRYLDSNLKI